MWKFTEDTLAAAIPSRLDSLMRHKLMMRLADNSETATNNETINTWMVATEIQTAEDTRKRKKQPLIPLIQSLKMKIATTS